MKIANKFKQNSRDWYGWRGKGIGASDAPAVMGASPWTTKFELWAQKVGVMDKPDFHPFAVSAMERGKLLEPKAREWYADRYNVVVEADVNCEHETYEYMRASLDGLVTLPDGISYLLEIKCPGKVDHAKALNGKVPDKYYPQLQFQLLVTGLNVAHYVSFDGETGVAIPVPRDNEYIARLVDDTVAFWGLVQTGVAPEVSADDLAKLADQLDKLSAKQASVTNALKIATERFRGPKRGARGNKVPRPMTVDGEDMEKM